MKDLDPDPDPYLVLIYSDPGGSKTYGSGSATLAEKVSTVTYGHQLMTCVCLESNTAALGPTRRTQTQTHIVTPGFPCVLRSIIYCFICLAIVSLFTQNCCRTMDWQSDVLVTELPHLCFTRWRRSLCCQTSLISPCWAASSSRGRTARSGRRKRSLVRRWANLFLIGQSLSKPLSGWSNLDQINNCFLSSFKRNLLLPEVNTTKYPTFLSQ